MSSTRGVEETQSLLTPRIDTILQGRTGKSA